MNTDKRKLTIQILSIIGFLITIKLAMIYYVANYEKYALSSFCTINDFVDCDGAAQTIVAQVFGIPLAYWGMFFYITVFFMTIVDKLKNIRFLKFLEVFKNPASYITFLGTLAFIISMVLAGFSVWKIHKLCILCVITYVLDFIIAIVSASSFKEYFVNFKTTFIDFIDGIKKYPKTFVVLLITSVAFLTVSEVTNVFTPHIKKIKERREIARMKENPYKINGNVLGNEKGDVVIHLYSDFVCPLCYINNIMLHKMVQEYSNILVIHHNFPFDTACNPELNFSMHPGACRMALAALAAEKQGNYWGMSSQLYENRPYDKETMDEILDKLGLDKDRFYKDMSSEEVQLKLKNEIKKTNLELGLDSTPTMYINGEKKVGVFSYSELRKLLESHGAKRRK